MWTWGTRTQSVRAFRCLAVCAVSLPFPVGSSSAQAPDSGRDELTEAILRYTFRYDGGNVRLLRGRIPDDLEPNFYVPAGTRVLGSAVTASSVVVIATSAIAPESLRAEYTRVLGGRGWKPLGSMQRGGFVEVTPHIPLMLCRDGAHLQITSSRRTSSSSDLVLHYRDGTGPCEPLRAVTIREMSEPEFPTLFAPPAPDELRTRCRSRPLGRRGSMGTQTSVAAAMSAEEVLRHYAPQIETQGWRPRATSGLAMAAGTWTRTDSTGTNELKLEVREKAATPGVRCYDVEMNVSGARR
jgi:hypothetical protein